MGREATEVRKVRSYVEAQKYGSTNGESETLRSFREGTTQAVHGGDRRKGSDAESDAPTDAGLQSGRLTCQESGTRVACGGLNHSDQSEIGDGAESGKAASGSRLLQDLPTWTCQEGARRIE